MQKIIFTAILLTMLALFTACSRGNSSDPVFRVATLVDDASPESLRLFEYFRAALEEAIGIPVVHIEETTHIPGIEAMRAGNLEMMWGSPFVYLLARQTTNVERLAVTDSPVAVNKAIFITNNPHIQTIDDMAGRSMAFISPSSTSGFLYPMYHLMQHFDMSRDEVATQLLSSVVFSGGHNAGVMGVINGDFDVAAVGNLNVQGMIASGLISGDEFRIIGSTEIIPFPGYLVAEHVEPQLRRTIQAFLLDFVNEAYFDERFNNPYVRFVLPNPEQIEHLASMAVALDIDLENA